MKFGLICTTLKVITVYYHSLFLCQCHHSVLLMRISDAVLKYSTDSQKVHTVILISFFMSACLNVNRMDAYLFYYLFGLDDRNWKKHSEGDLYYLFIYLYFYSFSVLYMILVICTDDDFGNALNSSILL